MAELPKLPLTFIRGPYEPLLIDHAEGAWLYTADGGKILDAAAGAVVTNIGQGREEIAQLMAEEVRRANYVVPIWSTPQRQRLVERLARWTPPGLTRFFFTSGGSEAVEAALKFALMYHKVHGRPQRTKIIAREASYHGNSHRRAFGRRQACAAPTTSRCCSIGRRSSPRTVTAARGTKPIPDAISIAPMRSKTRSPATARTRSRRLSPSR